MILKDIIAISGQSGLFKFLAQGKNSMIVEHLETGKRTTAFSSSRISSLDDITVFTQDEDLSLGKVFDRIYDREEGKSSVDSKSDPETLRKYFEEVVPEYSRERVYVSDIRKIIQWYNILQKKGMLIKEEPEKQAEEAETGDEIPRKQAADIKKKKTQSGSQEKK